MDKFGWQLWYNGGMIFELLLLTPREEGQNEEDTDPVLEGYSTAFSEEDYIADYEQAKN